jgi:hypothetical protein
MKNYLIQYSETKVYEKVCIVAETEEDAKEIFYDEYVNNNDLMFNHKEEKLKIEIEVEV